MRHPLGRHQPAPGDIAGVARQFLAEQVSAHGGVDAIGRDQHVAGNFSAVGECDDDAVRGLVESFDTRIEPKTFVGDTVKQNVEQVGAMRVVVGRTELRFRTGAQRGVVEAVAIVPGAVVASLRVDADARQRFAKPEHAQDAGGVGRELDAGAHLAERFGLLEQLGIDAARPQREQRSKSADAATGDEHFEIGPQDNCSSSRDSGERRS
jgi:hypothetical protein